MKSSLCNFVQTVRYAVIFAAAMLACALPASATPPLPPGVKVLFSPKDNLEEEIIKVINAADTEIVFSQNAITTPRIAEAIVRAFQVRKVYVAGILDRDPGVVNYTTPEYFRLNGIPVVFAKGTNNNKFIVINRTIVVTGSADLTRASMKRNLENVLIISEPSIAGAYRDAFREEYDKGELVPEPNDLKQ